MARTSRSKVLAFGLALVCALPAAAVAKGPERKAASTAAPKPAATTRAPAAGEIAELARAAIASAGIRLPKGASIVGARATADGTIPIAATRVTIEMTAPPKRAGKATAVAVLVFWKDVDIAARLPIAVDLTVPPEALIADVPKGAAVTLVVQRGDVEVSAPAVAAADADVGDVVQVLLRPSGRALRARIVSRDRAIAVEDGR